MALMEDLHDPDLEQELLALKAPKKLPPFIKARELPAPTRLGGAVLEPALVHGVVRACINGGALWRRMVRWMNHSLEPGTPEDLALALLAMWEAKKFNARYRWVMDLLADVGGDRAALALEPYLVSWPLASETGRKRAIETLPVFRRIGTDSALLALIGLSQKQVLPSVFEAAQEVLRAAAKDRLLSVDQLGDRIAPDCGLDERGGRVFDYGPRRFSLYFTDHFEPRVQNEQGLPLDDLPQPDAGDDPVKAREARAAWALAADQLTGLTRVQTARLEQCMVLSRRWSMKGWRQYLFGHPLMVNYTRRLVWGVFHGEKLRLSFRTAEDGTFVDVDDEEVPLPDRGRVGIIHPLHLSEDHRRRWTESMLDYELVPPFPQLERRVYLPTAEELEGHEVTRYADTVFAPKAIHDELIKLVWLREPGWQRSYFSKEFPQHELTAYIHIDPGMVGGGSGYADDQKVPLVDWRASGKDHQGDKNRKGQVRIDRVDPVTFSETLYDVTRILDATRALEA